MSEEAAKAVGLRPQQYQLLLMIKGLRVRGDEPSVRRLAERMGLKHHSVVGLLDRLEERRLIVRERVPSDLRQVNVRMTAKGEEVIEALSEYHQRVLRSLGPDLLRALRDIIRPAEEA
jgi:DNA-binding MarR family transcriptional regulator